MSTVLISGGTGLIGRALTEKLLQRGYEVTILTRNAKQKNIPKFSEKVTFAEWDTDRKIIDATAIENADYIVHLAGAGIADKRWTPKRKKEIVDSRVKSSQLIVESLEKYPNKIKKIISSSAIGWYGSVASGVPEGKGSVRNPFVELDPSADDFLGETCKQWEESILPVAELGKKLVILRTGVVLNPKGGALKEFLRPIKFGIAAILGSGEQIVSWIDIDDLVNMYIVSIENENIQGIYNAVAPQPVTNKELVIQLAKSRKSFFIPFRIPSFLLKTLFGELSIEVLKSS
ncbi:MAG TPA: TIGR01777 family oxidoreductase, partial [Chitinophagaceae bacterium]|nr:TIGR01777 family oxidoreductase [Chitinophagaceae bacterium]